MAVVGSFLEVLRIDRNGVIEGAKSKKEGRLGIELAVHGAADLAVPRTLGTGDLCQAMGHILRPAVGFEPTLDDASELGSLGDGSAGGRQVCLRRSGIPLR